MTMQQQMNKMNNMNNMTGWIDLTHRDSVYAFAADQYADKCNDDLAERKKFMQNLVKRNAQDRQQRVNLGELLYEMLPEPKIEAIEEENDEEEMSEACIARQMAKFNYVGKHKGKVAPKAKQLSDVYFEEQLMSDTYDHYRRY